MIEPIAINDSKATATSIHSHHHTHSYMTVSYHDSEEEDDATTTTDQIDFFEEELATLDDLACYQNTYFMDGGNRFISLPTLGNSNTKAAAHISRFFEAWLERKVYGKQPDDPLPILEDSIDSIAHDILAQLKSNRLWGLDKVFVKVRTGHVYTYHPLDDGQPLITQDMEEFFQQFPLFVEVIIRTGSSSTIDDDINTNNNNNNIVLLEVENVTVNPGNPYRIMEHISI
ncbi:hypothetical protein BDA99DRAFT_609835 [Phascolomyces articulosus]|uniref:Uncharacterized protein n=1 Tax=Phascolomyces articulosus TaxID=60185 RepID=A0AAD5P7J4_9FUNG|nr:hypothetical protein BDA99DRAFT_609835 [Phascolomyces articulosus]